MMAVAAVVGLALRGTAAKMPETDGGTTYARNGNTYTVRNVFQSSSKTPELLNICFDFKHLQQYYHGTEVRLVALGPDWQRLEYRTDYMIGTSTVVYKKTRDRAKNTVSFTMLSYKATGWGIAALTASSGSYAITDDGKIRTLTYEQSVTVDREIGPIDWSLIKRKTKAFFTDFEAYVRHQEKPPEQAITPTTGPASVADKIL